MRLKRVLFAAALLTTACASAPYTPVPPSSGPAPVGVGITVQPPTAAVHLTLGTAQCDTGADGVAWCYPVVAAVDRMRVEVPTAFEPVDDLPITLHAGNNDLIVTLTPLAPVGHEHGFLHVCGWELCDDDNQKWLFAGYANYVPLSPIAKGQDIGPVFDEAASYGANTLVGLGMDLGSWAEANGYRTDPRDPQWSTWVASLFDTAAQRHLRVYFAVFQQAQALSDAERKAIWQHACDIARGRWNVILALGNEDDVNGWRHEAFQRCNGDMGGVLLSTGSRGINNPPTPPNWDLALWEPRRGPYHKAMDDAGAGILEQHAGYSDFPAVSQPIVVIEPPVFNDTTTDLFGDVRWTDPKLALQLGLEIGANSAGGTFFSSLGMIGQPNGPIAAECARQFFRGLKAAFLR